VAPCDEVRIFPNKVSRCSWPVAHTRRRPPTAAPPSLRGSVVGVPPCSPARISHRRLWGIESIRAKLLPLPPFLRWLRPPLAEPANPAPAHSPAASPRLPPPLRASASSPSPQAANGAARRARRATDSSPRRTAVGSRRAAFASPGTGRKKGPAGRFFRPVPPLRRDRLSPSAGALGYYLSPFGLGRMKTVAAREETNGW
jgi:hypothetical protein